MLTSEMKEGAKISIVVDNLDFESEIKLLKEDYILISMIVIEDKILRFPKDIKADLVYYEEKDKIYIWEDVSIVPVKYKDGEKYHKIAMPAGEGKRYNRRSNFRMYIGKDMIVDVKVGMKWVTLKSMIKDVSATGFAFINNGEYEVGDRVTLYYETDTGKKIEFPSKIVRKQFMENLRSTIYGCEFGEPSDIMRKIVNEEQQKRLKDKMQ